MNNLSTFYCSAYYIPIITAYSIPTGNPIYHIAQDISNKDVIHLSTSHAFWTKNHADETPFLVTGTAEFGYREGNASISAQFRHIKSFAQTNSRTFILVDTYNKCLRQLDITVKSTSMLVGVCDGRGSKGTSSEVLFTKPTDISIRDQFSYITDSGSDTIYIMMLIDGVDGSPLIEKLDRSFSSPTSVAVTANPMVFYAAVNDGIKKVNFSDGSLIVETINTNAALISQDNDVLSKISWLNKEKTSLAVVNQYTGFIGMIDLNTENFPLLTVCSACHTPGVCAQLADPMAVTIRETSSPDVQELVIALRNGSIITTADSRTLQDTAVSSTTCSSSPSFLKGL